MTLPDPTHADTNGADGPDGRVSVVVLTYNRPEDLARVLRNLRALPESPAVVVVDNGSIKEMAQAVLKDFPRVQYVRSERNLGAAARNLGVAKVRTPFVAFCDDDTWWAPGALRRAADILQDFPAVDVLAARVLVDEAQTIDPTCVRMAASPTGAGLPGPALVAFMAGAAVMRTAAFHAAGGYQERLFLGAEELLLALDLLTAGGAISYTPDVVTHHYPSPRARNETTAKTLTARNRMLIAWMRLPAGLALRYSLQVAVEAARDGVLRPALLGFVSHAVWALRCRCVVPRQVSRQVARAFFGPAASGAPERQLTVQRVRTLGLQQGLPQAGDKP
jgi:GT2 family glycosyltransferase